MPKSISLTIDGQPVTVAEGTLIVNAARQVGINIPVFCYHPKMEPVGMCRQCLVEVGRPVIDRATGQVVMENGQPRIGFGPKLETACTTPVSEGMVVLSQSDKARVAQRENLEFLLTSHPLDCPVCDKGGECPLQNLTVAYGPAESRYLFEEKHHAEKHVALGDKIWLDRERCIQCAALHSLPGAGGRGSGAGLLPARPQHRHHHQFRTTLRFDLFRQHHRYLPGRRPDDGGFPLWRPAVGDEGCCFHLPALSGGMQCDL